MLWSERFVRDHRRKTDCAIHHAYADLASDSPVLEKFHELLLCARKRAPRLFEAPIIHGRHLGIHALVNLSRVRRSHIRPAIDWPGSSSSWRPAVSSLAHHLICEYRVPIFLASAWYATDAAADRKREWFVAHSRGASFRSLSLPIVMTRKMEHIFLACPDHLSIDHAIRRAELLSLGARDETAKAILATRLATDLHHSKFWHTVFIFLIANTAELDPSQILPIIDYIQALRHHRATLDTPEGMMTIDPPQPSFSIKGRTIQSMLRLMQTWHRSLGSGGPALSWMPSQFQPLSLTEPSPNRPDVPRRWHISELTNSTQLQSEGAALHHCVASYSDRCSRGVSSIWSLRLWQGEKVRHVLTVEVDPKARTIIQARGRANRAASGRSFQLLEHWATRERLTMTT